jgi:diacylglycerol kinase
MAAERGGFMKSVGHALTGIGGMLRAERNARIHAAATLAVVAFGLFVGLSRLEWCAIVTAIALVWTAEAFNTALERTVDLASPELHPLARKAKDLAAGAVLTSALGAALLGLLVFGPHLLTWVRRG